MSNVIMFSSRQSVSTPTQVSRERQVINGLQLLYEVPLFVLIYTKLGDKLFLKRK